MAGSKKWFVYTTDIGEDFAILLDESNTEAVMGSVQDYLNDASIRNAVPRNIKPRYAVYTNASGTRRVTCTVLNQTFYNGLKAGTPTISDPSGQGTLTLRQLQPEKITLPYGIDTGLDDGDAT